MIHYWMDKTNPTKRSVSTRCWLILILLLCVITFYCMYSEKIINSVTRKSKEKQISELQDTPKVDDEVKWGETSYNTLKGGGHFERAVDHYISGLDNRTRMFTYVVFSDPQIGLYDMMKSGDGSKWKHDIENMEKFSNRLKALEVKPDFVFCAGDLGNAFPYDEPMFRSRGFKPRLRPKQMADLKDALQKYFDNGIPMFTVPGNHDLSENTVTKHLKDFETAWGQSYFYFWNAGRVFIALETQVFRSNNPETVILRLEQIEWLKKLLASLPREAPKTVFQHVPMFMRESGEGNSGDTLPLQIRPILLRLFCENNVNVVFSGHTHVASIAEPYMCGGGVEQRVVQQVVLTSIVTPFHGGKPSYTVVNVDAEGRTEFHVEVL